MLDRTSTPPLACSAVVAVTDVTALDYEELALLDEVHRLVDREIRRARERYGPIAAVGTASWRAAPQFIRLAALLVCAEAWLIQGPERVIAERFKAMAVDLSQAHDWAAASCRLSNAELAARRAEPGALAAEFDPVVATRWVEAGSSAETAA